jgi:hypothetical protein
MKRGLVPLLGLGWLLVACAGEDPGPPEHDDDSAGDDDTVGDDTAGDDDTEPASAFDLVVGEEYTAGVIAGLSRPSIALDSLGQPHIVADNGNPQVYVLHRLGGQWHEELFAEWTAEIDASRVYLPHIEIDAADRAWISAWLGIKDGGTMAGQGVWLVDEVSSTPSSRFLGLANEGTKNGNLALDPGEPGVAAVMTKYGQWQGWDESGYTGESGQLDVGASGEKLRFRIRPRNGQAGVWHAVMSGYSDEDARYRNSEMSERVSWALHSTYDDMGEDMLHPGLGTDGVDPTVGYMSIGYAAGLVLNVWDGDALVYDPAALPVLDPDPAHHASGTERFGPQWTRAPGHGAFMCWTGGDGLIRVTHVLPDGSWHDPVEIGPGITCAMTTGDDGTIHMAYVNDVMRYRRIEVRPR